MAQPISFPFQLLDNDDFYCTVQSRQTSGSSSNGTTYGKNIVEALNSQVDNFDFSCDPNDHFGQYPTSKYYTVRQFTHQYPKIINNEFSLLHCNIRSMNSNFEQLHILLEDLQFSLSVIGLTETWFTDIPSSLYSLPGYELIFNNSIDRSGGGIALYISR